MEVASLPESQELRLPAGCPCKSKQFKAIAVNICSGVETSDVRVLLQSLVMVRDWSASGWAADKASEGKVILKV